MSITGGILGTMEPDNRIAKTYPPPDAYVVELAVPGAYRRGTVLSLETAGDSAGKYAVLGAGTGKARAVLAGDTEAGDDTAEAYRSGHFNRNALLVADEYELTAADEDELRMAGIFLSDGIRNGHPLDAVPEPEPDDADDESGGESGGT